MLGAASASEDEPPPSDEDDQCPTNRDQPHLRFEISSDDGFSVESDSIEGMASLNHSLNTSVFLHLLLMMPCIHPIPPPFFLNSPLSSSGLESSDRRGAGGSSSRQAETSDVSRHDGRLHAGTGPRCGGLPAGATPRCPPMPATQLPLLQTVQSGGRPSCQPQRLCPLRAVPEVCWLTKIRQCAFNAALLFITTSSHSVISYSVNRKSTFDIFNFLASQHRQLPDIGPYDDEEDEVLLKSTRLVLRI